jgi:hypothetical protein
MFGVCIRLFCVCVLCLGSGLATDRSLVQGIIPSVLKEDYETEEEDRAQQRAVESLMNKLKLNSVAFSPQTNYTDRATSAYRRS